MIPFTGTTQLKQYVKCKPNPVGLKNFVLASPDGLVLDFFIYQGAKTWPCGKPNPALGIGGTVVERLTKNVPKGSEIFMDRYFTSMNLLTFLLENEIYATGTIQQNRIPKELRTKLSLDKDLLKKGRGSFDEIVRQDEKISVIKWMDNKSVLLATTAVGSDPIQTVRRWNKTTKKYVNINCPNAITRYNNSMGDVDLADRLISYYRIAIRTKKWPVKVFWHMVDLIITNCWVMYKKDKFACGVCKKEIMDLLEFKLNIGECFAACAESKRRTYDQAFTESSSSDKDLLVRKKTKTPNPLPPEDVCRTENRHLPICGVTDKNKFMRCRREGCHQKTRFKCTSCNVFLCIANDRQCFFEFHS
ncbi:piggyBac transposable element-derived protein 3-like [Teleopsis dalmanni]|uniref:piggyBac transposable element-derived protein 3-like n=1 Tax=Teleopsis dalmanni TaxID=139649 RepID=UPI0018CE41F0|nr:piggyBac transposable element-derived protein 3-like [Teleopsis dalmanni]